MIPDSWMQELFSKVDIVSVISEYTTLVPKGGRLWACCPFHNEKTPSFKVDTDTQLYYCFGCHKGGTVITFLMEKENVSYIEAIGMLAERAGMQLPSSGYSEEEAKHQKERKTRLQNANRDAARYYFEQLKKGGAGLEYLRRRGLSDSIIKRFGLGFAPDGWTNLCDYLRSLGYTDDEIVDAGLARRSEGGRIFDFFRNRVIFPIIDPRHAVLAFGGRTMGSDEPKYLNTGDTPIYNKRNNVYALNMLGKGTHADIIICEGYMDVISLHAAGVDNAVATLGTALTENQAKLLKRRTNVIYVSYDGDSAGQNATMRGLDILAKEGLDVRVIVLPDGLDPDDYAKKYGRDGYMRLKDESLSLPAFKIEHTAKKYDMQSADDRQKFAAEACKIVAALSPIEQERYYDMVSRMSGYSFETLRKQGALSATEPEIRNIRPRISNNNEKAPSFAKTDRDRAELLLASCAAKSQEAALYIMNEGADLIERAEIRDFITAVYRSYTETGACDIALIINSTEGDSAPLAAAVFEAVAENPVQSAKECINRLRTQEISAQLIQLGAALDAHEITSDEYKARFAELNAALRRVKQQ